MSIKTLKLPKLNSKEKITKAELKIEVERILNFCTKESSIWVLNNILENLLNEEEYEKASNYRDTINIISK